jgi:hypothetical protein
MNQKRIGAAALAVLSAALLLGGAMPALGQGQVQQSPAASAPSGPPVITNIGPSATDPVATVNTLLDVVIGRRFDQVVSFACAASAAELDSHLNFDTIFTNSMPAGTDIPGLLDTITLSIPDRVVTLVSSSGDSATVHIAGTLVIGVDEAALRPWVKTLLVNSGQDSSDATVDATLAQIVKSLAVTAPVTRDVALTMDGGHWLVCDSSIGASPTP